MRTYLIVPAFSDMAGQCRIVARDGDHKEALRNYRADPSKWSEVGLMNSRGSLVCMDGPKELIEMMKADEPLAAGYEYAF